MPNYSEQEINTLFHSFIRSQHLFQKEETVLLAVSGGADSMMMVHLFLNNYLKFGIAHCNFHLRGEDSDRDEKFVRNFAASHGIPFYSISFQTAAYAESQKLSIEEAARELRYTWFEEIRVKERYAYIATAHHINDNVETMLFHLFRGTGIRGLHGILPKRGRLIRPMLFLSKEDILNYIQAKKITYVEDYTNQSSDYSRNFIRNVIIPEIEKMLPNAVLNMDKSIHRFRDAEYIFEEALSQRINGLKEIKGEEIHIPVLKLIRSKPLKTIIYEVFKPYGFGFPQLEQILKLAGAETGKYINSSSYRLLKDRKWLIISPLKNNTNQHLLIKEEDKKVEAGNSHLIFKRKEAGSYQIPQDASIAAIDLDTIEFPLYLRKWKEGDYFYPLGMRKKKKVARFFIDQKLSLNEKENTWILFSGNKLVWIVGRRMDDRFKIRPSTKAILEITVRS